MIMRKGKQKWEVKMVDNWVFGEGWDDFMIANGVQDFDIVVFKHQGDMVFDTMVFDSTWCERGCSNNQVTKCAKTMVLHQNDHHPCFVGTLRKYQFHTFYMPVPKKFALANGLSNGEIIFMDVNNEDSWIVKLRNQMNKRFCIEHGLREFCMAIGLRKGDSFRFELIHHGSKPVAIVSRLPNPGLVNPYFRSTVTAFVIKNASMTIPMAFARSNKLNMRDCDMCVMDEKMRLWPTKLRHSETQVRMIGLCDMLVANALKEGDEFILELVDNGNKPLMNFHR
ncbi:hypothetical protein QVD17_11855 [Tagetes erecta]|uniref:TF-B3 domain-containing protein n=1 Tax=Tagetes erecta TaxID=13708 RepID=A0AAD8KYS6_TARER|nr:hypothetical protein QVD17_11855 [Tagetes erecta]